MRSSTGCLLVVCKIPTATRVCCSKNGVNARRRRRRLYWWAAHLPKVRLAVHVLARWAVYMPPASTARVRFANVAGREDFSEHTPYMVPGSIMVPHTPGGLTSSLFTTLHYSLNLIRARMWYGPGGVAGAVDHTFKASHTTHALQFD